MSATTTYPDGRTLAYWYDPERHAYLWALAYPDGDRSAGVYYFPLWRGSPGADLSDAMRTATDPELIPAWSRGSAEWRTGPDGAHGADYPDPLDR